MLNVAIPREELYALRPKNGAWIQLAFVTLLLRMEWQREGVRSGCVQSVCNYFCFAYCAIEFARAHPIALRNQLLKQRIEMGAHALEQSAFLTPYMEEQAFMRRLARKLRHRVEELPNAPPP